MIELLQPNPAETRHLLQRPATFRNFPLADGALPPREILDQSRYLLTDAPLSYRWTIPFLVLFERKIVGSVGGKGLLDEEDIVELGYNVAADFQRRGIGTAMIRMITEMAKADGLRLLAHVEVENIASQRTLEKNNFHLAGTFYLPDSFALQRWLSAPAPRHP